MIRVKRLKNLSGGLNHHRVQLGYYPKRLAILGTIFCITMASGFIIWRGLFHNSQTRTTPKPNSSITTLNIKENGSKGAPSGSNGSTAANTSKKGTTDNNSSWSTYKDTGYSSSSGIQIKYPSDWEINIEGNKAVGNTKNPIATINLRAIFLTTSQTAHQEWNTCGRNVSADACGYASGDKEVSGNEFTINGLDTYSAVMQNNYSIYHVTIIRGNKSIPPGGTPYDEFRIISSDPSVLSTYATIMNSATFPKQ